MPRKARDRKASGPRPRSSKKLAETLLSSTLLETIPDAIAAVDHKGTIVQVNSRTEELFGYKRDKLIGQKVELLVPEGSRPHHIQHRKGFAKQPKPRRMGAGLDLYGGVTVRSFRWRSVSARCPPNRGWWF